MNQYVCLSGGKHKFPYEPFRGKLSHVRRKSTRDSIVIYFIAEVKTFVVCGIPLRRFLFVACELKASRARETIEEHLSLPDKNGDDGMSN